MNKHGGYYGNDQNEIVDFSVNINPLGVPQKLIEALEKELIHLVRYPEINGESARHHIAQYLSTSKDNVILGNGATELIYLWAKALKPKRVGIIQPTFTEYERAFQRAGSHTFSIYLKEEMDFILKEEEIINQLEKTEVQAIVLCNPNNPTGTYAAIKTLIPLLRWVKDKKVNMFIDESFIEFTSAPSLINYIDNYPVFLLRSMTKEYGIPGLRLGYGLGNRSLIDKLHHHKEPWTVNSLALKAVGVLLEDEDYRRQTQEWLQREKQFLYEGLINLSKIKPYRGEANFLLCKVLDRSAKALQEKLLKEGIFIRTCEDFKGLDDHFIRIALRDREENEKLLMALNKVLEESANREE